MILSSYLQHRTPRHVPELSRFSLPGSLDTHGSGEENMHEVEELHGDVSVLVHQLLVTALISIIPSVVIVVIVIIVIIKTLILPGMSWFTPHFPR